jgi:hypothetical protein
MNDSNHKIVELHKIAAHAHLAAAEEHGKGDHISGHEATRIAMEHSTKAFEMTQTARRESERRSRRMAI